MHIEHVAIWTDNLEELKEFYEGYFQVRAGEKYYDPGREFESYFLSFSSGARLELMRRPGVPDSRGGAGAQIIGLTHLAISVGSKEEVDALTARLEADSYQVVSPARTTGDGYYESVALDPDGNRIEITI